MLNYFLFIFGLAFLIVVITEINKHKRKKTLSNFIKNNNIKYDIIFYQNDGKKALLIDEEKSIISIYKYISDVKIHKYSTGIMDIISFELLENENSLSKYNRGSQLGGAVVGGLLLGGVGAVVGGLSGSQHQEKYCNSIKIKFLFNNLKYKTDEIIFLEGIDKKGFKKDSIVYNAAFKEAEKFYDTLCILMKKENVQKVEVVNEEIYI